MCITILRIYFYGKYQNVDTKTSQQLDSGTYLWISNTNLVEYYVFALSFSFDSMFLQMMRVLV
jgi:hypothetical protein